MSDDHDKVPLFKTWKKWYFAVLLFLVVLIILFSIFTKTFS
ncbi:MAG TPA: hypothetical protein VI548_12530 [Chitinophagaceae bacterium]|nr:hypothetical protein [Chitinophagaceae bacterium]